MVSISTLSLPLIDDVKAAELLGTTVGTLAVWRCNRRVNLPFVKLGRAVRYRLEDIEKYIVEHTVGGTPE